MKTELKIEFESPYDHDLKVVTCAQDLLSAISEIGQHLRNLDKYSGDNVSQETAVQIESIRKQYYQIIEDHVPSLLDYL